MAQKVEGLTENNCGGELSLGSFCTGEGIIRQDATSSPAVLLARLPAIL
jgi:hypothetical protein